MRVFASAALLGLFTLSVQAAPPEGVKLSQIIAQIEQTADFHYLDEIEWKDRGYYEIEYYTRNGAKVEIRIDPASGEPVR
ncbi:PepSY domain-containing protein [Devosia sp. YIM 151766]|uniref:PepSY domain-containing protein n=1 Tax=Devosia sp. YIM 151766 TaxID=3017325 RepID=UPI00255D15B2|nr:PepSY domain-containing protein [Devosia sp. YIM 151766]WIY52381.1 PepSY domain-containing protein [Devosia sp. YIM 151766]